MSPRDKPPSPFPFPFIPSGFPLLLYPFYWIMWMCITLLYLLFYIPYFLLASFSFTSRTREYMAKMSDQDINLQEEKKEGEG